MRRPALFALTVAIAVLLGGLALNTARQRSRQVTVPAAALAPIDVQAAAERLAGAVRLRTISFESPSEQSLAELLKLHTYLAQAFPNAHRAMTREIVGGYSLLYTWNGEQPSAKPILLMAHQDVVPIAPGTEDRWHADPFGGEIRDGFVWGRGSWDDKGNLMAILEAVDALVAAGFKPRRTIYLAFGHDEENGGENGAAKIAELLAQRGIHCEFALDEGLVTTEGIMPGLAAPLALIGIAEKGFLTVRLTATATPGHSSMPPKTSAIGALAKALTRLEASPMPAGDSGVAAAMLDTIAPEMRGLQRVALSNRWLFGPLIRARLERAPSTDALLRTTTAITVISGGNKENVLPGTAQALVNFRILPGDTVASIFEHVKRCVGDAAIRVEIASPPEEASTVSSRESNGYRVIERTIRELFPEVLVAPGLVIGATDSRHMSAVADDIYRYSPVRATPADLARFHGTDERMDTANYAELIRFYGALIRHAAGAP